METVLAILASLQALPPLTAALAVIAMCIVVIYHISSPKGNIRKIKDNHLTHMAGDLADVKTGMENMSVMVGEMRDGILLLVDRTRHGQ